MSTQEHHRLTENREQNVPWKRWGPYLSERQWGTVREDYSQDGNAWDYFTHDQARSRAYRWGEDGLAGISDDRQLLCFALALWNERDPILKERLFGLSNSEGNHGEDVKEYYFYLDSTPTHSYMKYLYKYPQRAYPYEDLVGTNRQRSRNELEYELLDTGIFDDDRYFDVFVEYAKAGPDDLLIQISLANRGPEAARLRVLPTLWFRNTWFLDDDSPKPMLRQADSSAKVSLVQACHPQLSDYFLYCAGAPPLLFTENDTNRERIFGQPSGSPYVKDAFHNYLIHDQTGAVNPAQTGTKVAALYTLTIGAGETQTIHLRLTSLTPTQLGDTPLAEFEATLAARLAEADAFYRTIIPCSLDADSAQIIRQALAGMLWSKQYYFYEVDRWLQERVTELAQVPRRRRLLSRNSQWYHMVNAHIISMPDKWEYPWYAAWDLAFHTVALDMVDPDFARQQLDLMLREYYLHPNGQLPAYEWNFGDVNPPVHAWAAHYIHQTETIAAGSVDFDWLKHAFQKLLLNFTWWVNRKDPGGRNVFEGGFLGLDNIGVFDRSAPLPTGGYLEQADGTAWMALFSQNMLQIALELAQIDEVYADMSAKFFEHFLWIASAMDCIGDNEDEMWDEADGFFYDLLRLPNGQAMRLKVRSLVGLLPLCASTVIGPALLEKLPQLRERARWFVKYYPDLIANIHNPLKPGYGGCYLLSILNEDKLRRVLARMLDEKEFLSPYGIRSVSLYHAQQPYVFYWDDQEYRVDYLPAESNNGMFGGNSNWRGPIWMPINALLVRALANLYVYYGDDFRVECPTGSGRLMTLFQVAEELTQRLASIFRRNSEGRRPVYGDTRKFQEDPHWRDYLLFYEYFHGDNGAGLGASHQTGWTGVIAKLLQFFSSNGGQEVLNRTYGSSAGPE